MESVDRHSKVLSKLVEETIRDLYNRQDVLFFRIFNASLVNLRIFYGKLRHRISMLKEQPIKIKDTPTTSYNISNFPYQMEEIVEINNELLKKIQEENRKGILFLLLEPCSEDSTAPEGINFPSNLTYSLDLGYFIRTQQSS